MLEVKRYCTNGCHPLEGILGAVAELGWDGALLCKLERRQWEAIQISAHLRWPMAVHQGRKAIDLSAAVPPANAKLLVAAAGPDELTKPTTDSYSVYSVVIAVLTDANSGEKLMEIW